MLNLTPKRLGRLLSLLRLPIYRRGKAKVVIRKLGKGDWVEKNGYGLVQPKGSVKLKKIKIASFNAAFFSMAPAVPMLEKPVNKMEENSQYMKVRNSIELSLRTRSLCDRPRGILKNSSLRTSSALGGERKSRLKVSINLPDNEISMLRNRRPSVIEDDEDYTSDSPLPQVDRAKPPMRSHSTSYLREWGTQHQEEGDESFSSRRTMLDVLEELDIDILAMQDVKAVEERDMKPLSDLAAGLGMNYAFAESWAPEYGNAILSKWPIKEWKAQKISDDSDYRNVLMATIDVPHLGEINFYCTVLDHLDEDWRMKQITSIMRSNGGVHILAGGLNTLDESDYSVERWSDIIKYYEEIGKPTPKAEVMKFLKSKCYVDAKEFAGECESVVIIAKGQSVQGTCKYGTRVDYILASPDAPYQFVPGSYSVVSSKGTSDHHIVKVDVVKAADDNTSDSMAAKSHRRHQPESFGQRLECN